MRIAILTLGCKTNQAESFDIDVALRHNGHQIVSITDSPDFCIINTCTVTAKADQQSRQLIHKALRNGAKVIVTGCYAELNSALINTIGEGVTVFNNSNKRHIISYFDKLTSTADYNIISGTHSLNAYYPRHRPIVKVQDGCNYSCSYCSIPMARGRSRSEPFEDIINKVKHYHDEGYKEIVLTGIHLGTYGFDFKPKKSLSLLLQGLLDETAMARIRLSSLEINEIDDNLMQAISDPRICNHLHIPLQSGEDSILASMNRSYKTRDYRLKLELITRTFPDISIGTDIITGFPGEDDESFLRTCSFIEAMPFSYLHVFPYSSRPNTRATLMRNQTPEDIKKRRVSILRAMGEAKRRAYIEKHINKTLQIIVEDEISQGIIGTSANYIKVLLADGLDYVRESLINVRVTGYEDNRAVGTRINN